MGTYTIKANGREISRGHYDSSYTVQSEAKRYSQSNPNDHVEIYLYGIRFHQYKAGKEFWT